MSLKSILKEKNISQYKLSKLSFVPYTTINDICSEKTKILKCSVEALDKIAKSLDLSVDYLIEDSLRCDFELFKSNVCHKLKELTDIPFIIDVLESNEIRTYYNRKWYPEYFYLLATLDYLSRINDVPLCNDYHDIRQHKLKNIVYPNSILAIYSATRDEKIKDEAYQNSIPEYKQFNIVEREIRNVA